MWSRTAFVWAGTLALIVGSYAACTWSRSLAPSRTIMVSAEGKAMIKPDLATITFSVVSEGPSATAIQAENSRKMNDATAIIKGFGVDPKDIQTSSYNLSPKYSYEQKTGKSSIDGYQITQSVTVKVRNLDNAGKIVGALPTSGVNQISGPSFSVENVDSYLSSARAEAFMKARAKAEALARAAGVSIGRVVTFSENSGGGYPRPMYMKADMAVGGESPAFEPGTDEAQVNVNVTFEIR